MKTTKISIKNLFGINELELDGRSVEFSGPNGAGKTSVLDAIKYALTNKSPRDFTIKQGATEGEILIETDNGISITRKPRQHQTDYKSIKDNGKVVQSSESFLRELFTELQLSPVTFLNESPQEQNRIILDLIEYPWNLETIREWFGEIPPEVNYDQNILKVLHDIQDDKGYYFMKRQDINRDIRNKSAIVEDIAKDIPNAYDAEKWKMADLAETYKAVEKMRQTNAQIDKANQMKSNYDNKIRGFQAEKEIEIGAIDKATTSERSRLENEIIQLEETIKRHRQSLSTLEDKRQDKIKIVEEQYNSKVAKYDGEMAEFEKYLTIDRHESDLTQKIQEAQTIEKMKGHLNEYSRMTDLSREIEKLKEGSQLLTDKIEKARSLPGEILETATLPIDGLTVEHGIPLIHGLPVSNLSEGEKLDLCVDITINKPSTLQIILIDGVEKLTSQNRDRLYAKCKEKGLQFITTRTADGTDLEVVYFE